MNSLAQIPVCIVRSKLQLPMAVLIALLQRTPVVRVLAVADEVVASSPLGSVLKSALAVAASLGAMHSLAGATALVASQSSPVSAKVGTAMTPVAFTVSNTLNIASWRIGGALPPGLAFTAVEDSSKSLTGPGMLDATTPGRPDGYGGTIGGNPTTTPVLSGTPTTAGNYTFTLQAFEFAGLTGLATNTFNFSMNVAAADVVPPSAVAPIFTAQPQSQSVSAGTTVTLSAAATGTPAPTFQWNKNGAPISGATNSTLVLTSAQAADAASYTVTAMNSAGNATSAAAAVTITVTAPTQGLPAFTQAPLSPTVLAGATVAFNVTATGSPAPTFQWSKDGVAISGATKSSLILTNVTTANAGSYTVVATNSAGSTTSAPGSLALTSATNFGHLTNLSVLAALTSQVPNFTVATVIGGGLGNKPLLVRAAGPSLTQFGVGGAVAGTQADLYVGSTLLASNGNWNGAASLATAFASVGAFPYASATSQDSAIFLPAAAPGSYSVQVSGVGGATGLLLAELYDAMPAGSFTAATARFLDVSVLKQIASAETLTVGFNIGGDTSRTVLVRAVGPALAEFGLSGTMPDPRLDLHSGSTVLASNNSWGGDPQISAAFSAVGAFGFSDPASKDAVIIATLAPGNYSAVVTSISGSAGFALVEVYDVP